MKETTVIAAGKEALGSSASPVANRGTLVLTAAVFCSFAFCYADVFRALWVQWNTNEANSHGLLIPWISLYLLWRERDRLPGLTARPAWWAGLPLLIASLATLLAGRTIGVMGLQQVSMVGTLWGVILLVLGWPGFRLVWFPAAYLLFMMPVWDIATEPMYRPLQLFAACGTEFLLSAFGVPVFRDGTLLHLPNTSVEVAFACSGINFLMSVLAIGLVLSYLLGRGIASRMAIVLTAAVVALLANPLRVTVIVYSFYSGLASPQQSHMWQGLLVSLGAFAVLFVAASRIGGPLRDGASPLPFARDSRASRSRAPVVFACLCCLLLMAGGYARPLEWKVPSLQALKLDWLPSQIGEWQALPGARPPVPSGALVEPDEFWREYRHPSGTHLRVYIGRFAHNHEGHGLRYWSTELQHVASFAGAVPRPPGVLNTAFVGRRRAEATPVAYWYQLGGRATTSRAMAKLHLGWTAAMGGTGPLTVALFGEAVGLSRPDHIASLAGDIAKLLLERSPAERGVGP